MRLARFIAALIACAAACLAPSSAYAEGDEPLSLSIENYSANISDITVNVRVTNNSAEQIGFRAHRVGDRGGQQRVVFKKGTPGQDTIVEGVKVPCDTAQAIEVEYTWQGSTRKPVITSVPQACQVAHSRDKELAHTPAIDPTVWQGGVVLMVVGMALRLLGRRPRRAH